MSLLRTDGPNPGAETGSTAVVWRTGALTTLHLSRRLLEHE
jgi:hypothetical protein